MRPRNFFVATLLTITLCASPETAVANKVGGVCKKLGATKTIKNVSVVCKKERKKFIWVEVRKRPTPTPTPTYVETEASRFIDPSRCQISRPIDADDSMGHYGFPRGKDFLPSQGVFTGLIIPVEFSDAIATKTPEENMKPYVEDFVAFWKEMSKGSVNFELTTLKNWVSMPKRAQDYAGKWPHNPQMEQYVREVIAKVDDSVDFSKYKIVYIIPVDDVTNFFEVGPVVASGNSDYFKSAEGPIQNLVVGSNPSISMGGVKWKWLAHETGHLFGIFHPHSYENNDKKLASIFSLMDFGYVAPGLYGWERWLVDWIPSVNIRCFDFSNANSNVQHLHKLVPIGSTSGVELVIYRVSEQRALVLENRRATKFDKLLSEYEGVLVYEVNSAKYEGAITPVLGTRFVIDQSQPNYNGSRVVGTLRKGELVNFNGLRISILDNSGEDFIVQVTSS